MCRSTSAIHVRAIAGALVLIVASAIAIGQTVGRVHRFDTQLSTMSTGPDIIIGDMRSVMLWGRVGDINAYSVAIHACNVGDERVSWRKHTNAHPVCPQGIYRLKEGRFEQIGMGWASRGCMFALSQSLCSPCLDPTDGSELGVGCSNPDSAYIHGFQINMSPRSDVNAHTGYFPYPLEGPEPEETIGNRIQVHDVDIDPDSNEGALYFVEGHFIAADDAAAGNGNNNASYRPVAFLEPYPDSFNVSVADVTQREQPAIRAWEDTDRSVVETDVQVPGEGLFILAAKATDLGNGFWHYEYALQNLNSDRSAGSFSVPVPAGVLVENIGFHDVDYHSGEIYDLTDWPANVEDEAITWATDSYDDNPNANALRFDTLYNFRFDANVRPGWATTTIGLFKPGTPQEVTAKTIGPLMYQSTGPDIIIADLQNVIRYDRVGDITAYSSGTNVCNVGDERVSYIKRTNAHPVCVQGMYRLKDDRIEQIGMSWVWHGFCAISQSLCSPCLDPTDMSELGVGCSNPESAYLMGIQTNLSLRSDVNADTGYFPYPWEAPEPDEIIGRRIQVHDADLDPDLNGGALYFVQGHYITADDATAGNGNNNASYRPVAVIEPCPDSFNVVVTGITQREQPAIRAWQDTDSSVFETDVQVPGEGLFILAAKATDLGDGYWHYEYALQNLNSDRSAGSFSVPAPAGALVENIGFHDVDYHSGEIYDLTAWPGTVDDEAITWATDSYDDNPNANALRFDTLYNFRFDAKVSPSETLVTIGLFKPGSPNEVTARTLGPLSYSTGPDIIIGDLQGVTRFGRVSDITAYAVGTNVCNVGTERVKWIKHNNQHPVWVQGMFRFKDGRFEQIGMSWLRHGFFALSSSLCSPCLDPTDGSELGVGCSNANCAYLNGVQGNMSLRSDVNAHTGYFPYPWTAPDWDDITDKRVQVHDIDIDPDLNQGALYFVESHHVAADDAAAGNSNNNASYRPITVTELESDIFDVVVTGVTQREQPAIRAWQDTDSSVFETDVQVPGEGLFILAAKATDLGNGSWHYEYALQNLNSDRSAGSFSVPAPAGALVENIGFHDVDYHSGEIYDLTNWPANVEDEAITWATDNYDDNPNANALRFDTLYNFRFDAKVSPSETLVTIGLFKPGSPNEVTAVTFGPLPGSLDCNGNGIPDACDLECGDGCEPPCGESIDCNQNNIPDECEPDCNRNGVADECDISYGTSNDCNENRIPDECEPDRDGDGIPDDCDDHFNDIDGDGIADYFDLCPLTTPEGACVCPPLDLCCFPNGICIDDFPRQVCIDDGGTPDCIETPCRDGCLIGDHDSDGDRDLLDIAEMQLCYTGPFSAVGYNTPSSECILHFDFDEDGDIDLDDFQQWQSAYEGP